MLKTTLNWLTLKLRTQFQSFGLLGDYFRAIVQRWHDILWGASFIAVAFVLWWFLGNPPVRIIALYLVAVMFIAGYYAWRADHVRLMPKFEVKEFKIQENPTQDSTLIQIYIQVVPKCLTEAVVNECSGHLLRVYKKDTDKNRWESTTANEPVLLEWSFHEFAPLTLQPGIDQRLNVCFWTNRSNMIVPRVEPRAQSMRYYGAFHPYTTGTFRFEIRVTAENCPPVDISVEVTNERRDWNKPIVELIQGHLTLRPSAIVDLPVTT